MTRYLEPDEHAAVDAQLDELSRIGFGKSVEPREPGAPDWWYGEDDAAASMLAATRQMTASG